VKVQVYSKDGHVYLHFDTNGIQMEPRAALAIAHMIEGHARHLDPALDVVGPAPIGPGDAAVAVDRSISAEGGGG
jgi:hypothetical protein